MLTIYHLIQAGGSAYHSSGYNFVRPHLSAPTCLMRWCFRTVQRTPTPGSWVCSVGVFLLLRFRAYRFLKSIEGKGDLYGPFWVATTLIFAIAFSGNIVDYKNSVGKGEQDVWRYDFDKGAGSGGEGEEDTFSLALIMLTWGPPLPIWFVLGVPLPSSLCPTATRTQRTYLLTLFPHSF